MNELISFYQESDLPGLIQNVVLKKTGAQSDFIDALPTFLRVMSPFEIQQKLIPFLINWLDFANRTIATRLSELLPSFFRPIDSRRFTHDLLFPVLELIRESALFIEPQMLKLCDHVISTFNSAVIEDIFLPSLDQLIESAYTDSQCLAILMESKFLPYVSSKWAQSIYNQALSLAPNTETFPRLKLLDSLDKILCVSKEPIKTVLIPSLSHTDYKVRSHAILVLSQPNVSNAFFSEYPNASPLISLGNDKSWAVRFSFSQNSPAIIHNYSTLHPNQSSLFAPILFSLARDTVPVIKAMALSSISKTAQYFIPESFSEFSKIFSASIRDKNEEIRTNAIQCWSSLLKYHSNVPNLSQLNSFLFMMNTVPVESLVSEMLENVVPFLTEEKIDLNSVETGLQVLLKSSTPRWGVKGLKILRIFVTVPFLAQFAVDHFEIAETYASRGSLLFKTAFCESFVEFVKVLGWEWYNIVGELIVEQWMKKTIEERKCMIRTIIQLFLLEPDDPTTNHLTEYLKIALQDDDEGVKLCTRQCLDEYHIEINIV